MTETNGTAMRPADLTRALDAEREARSKQMPSRQVAFGNKVDREAARTKALSVLGLTGDALFTHEDLCEARRILAASEEPAQEIAKALARRSRSAAEAEYGRVYLSVVDLTEKPFRHQGKTFLCVEVKAPKARKPPRKKRSAKKAA